jgi:hypothetical protein
MNNFCAFMSQKKFKYPKESKVEHLKSAKESKKHKIESENVPHIRNEKKLQ